VCQATQAVSLTLTLEIVSYKHSRHILSKARAHNFFSQVPRQQKIHFVEISSWSIYFTMDATQKYVFWYWDVMYLRAMLREACELFIQEDSHVKLAEKRESNTTIR
jgi:predicted nucleic acid-binding protein